MHPLRLLLHLVPLVLVEQRTVPRSRRAAAVIPLARRFEGRAQGGKEGGAGQQHVAVQVPYHPELLPDVSQGLEPGEGDCGD